EEWHLSRDGTIEFRDLSENAYAREVRRIEALLDASGRDCDGRRRPRSDRPSRAVVRQTQVPHPEGSDPVAAPLWSPVSPCPIRRHAGLFGPNPIRPLSPEPDRLSRGILGG